uniref:Sulfatase n=1 Tax=Haemonchus placei TaxID=6290 RepID=A0A0N4XA13_HAEPC
LDRDRCIAGDLLPMIKSPDDNNAVHLDNQHQSRRTFHQHLMSRQGKL